MDTSGKKNTKKIPLTKGVLVCNWNYLSIICFYMVILKFRTFLLSKVNFP